MARTGVHITHLDAADQTAADIELRERFVRQFGRRRAATLLRYHQLLAHHGPFAAQRELGPERYVDMLVALRNAGVSV